MQFVAAALYRLTLALWVGGIALFTFVVTPILFRTQGRDAAGKIVGTIFPHYFRYVLVLAGVVLLLRLLSGEAFRGWRRVVGTLLAASAIFLAGYQAYSLLPRMEEVKRAAVSFETAAPDSASRKEFSRLHGISMVLNMIVLLEGATLAAGAGPFRR
ncbi:MAG: DUF4149 domain-containing protein [Thermodesulfobacteriota bacterium]